MNEKIEKMIKNNIDELWDKINVIAQTDSNIYCMKEDLSNMFLDVISEALAEKDAEIKSLNEKQRLAMQVIKRQDAEIERLKNVIRCKNIDVARLNKRLGAK